MLTGTPSASRCAKVSRSIMRATVSLAMSAKMSFSPNSPNHSDCQRTSVRAGSTTRWNWARYVSAFARSGRPALTSIRSSSERSTTWATRCVRNRSTAALSVAMGEPSIGTPDALPGHACYPAGRMTRRTPPPPRRGQPPRGRYGPPPRPRSGARPRPGVAPLPAIILGVFALLATGLFVGVMAVYGSYTSGLPDPSTIDDVTLDQGSRVVSADGVELATFAHEDRRAVTFDQIPEVMRNAQVAAEDRSFWTNPCIDFRGIARAVLQNLTAGREVSGASTI